MEKYKNNIDLKVVSVKNTPTIKQHLKLGITNCDNIKYSKPYTYVYISHK